MMLCVRATPVLSFEGPSGWPNPPVAAAPFGLCFAVYLRKCSCVLEEDVAVLWCSPESGIQSVISAVSNARLVTERQSWDLVTDNNKSGGSVYYTRLCGSRL
jgi:hypothetical protein